MVTDAAFRLACAIAVELLVAVATALAVVRFVQRIIRLIRSRTENP